MSKPTLWIFEDQLSLDLPMFAESPDDSPVLMIESRHAFSMYPYHKKRLTFLISAMRHFAEELKSTGRRVEYYPLKAKGYRDSLSAIRHHVKTTGSSEFWVTEPSEYHTRAWLETLPALLNIKIRFFPNTLFLTNREDFAKWARGLKSPVMEFFYRKMRQKHNVLMDGKEPVGGEWNLDKENRKSNPDPLMIPKLPSFKPDEITAQAIHDVEKHFSSHYGELDGFDYPVTRADASRAFEDFLDKRLKHFGEFEDAMVQGQPTLFHSLISPLINVGLLDPMTCIRAVEVRYKKGKAPLNSVEGFIRQILGWREYVYGIYWTFMPEYRERNARKDDRPLPQFFWDGKTEMNCLKQCIGNVVENAYSHHIQRLMVICNFATLTGISPQAVNDWFLAMYIDSHDWVVTPNVIGMAMNADGGTMATKPYVSSAAYINRMSNYCKHCTYNQNARTGSDACPFNYLYWTFLDAHRETFKKNPRMTMILKGLDKMEAQELQQMREDRKVFLAKLETTQAS